MSVIFFRGQQLGRNELNIFLENTNGTPLNAAEVSYALFDFTTGQEVVLGNPTRTPENPSVGEYYASMLIPNEARLGDYRIRWTFREYVGAPVQQVVQEFGVIDKVEVGQGGGGGGSYTPNETALIRSMRLNLRDSNPDRHYRFQPPAHEETIGQYNRVFGYIWEDHELYEFLLNGLDMISAAPPRTVFNSIDSLMQTRREWRTLLVTGGMMWALNALRINWIGEEFSYSIGGVSLDLEKSSKYEAAYSSMSEQFTSQLEQAKSTVKIIAGLQQARMGSGIRSSFGPYVGAGILTPRKFL